MNYIVSGITHIGRIRSINQDNFYLEGVFRDLDDGIKNVVKTLNGQEQWTVAVFDGMGGEKDGEIASLIAAETTKEICSAGNGCADLGELITAINSRICSEMENRKCRMGSTCVFLEFSGNKCRSWNVGDSRAYLYHKGELIQLSEDHTEAALYAGYFNDDSVMKNALESRLTQCLGISENEFIIEPSVSSWNIVNEHDLMLMCSDGLTHAVEDEEIRKVLSDETQLCDKLDVLLGLALGRGGTDNTTIIIIEASEKEQ